MASDDETQETTALPDQGIAAPSGGEAPLQRRGLTLLELGLGQCRYPLGEFAEPVRFFCGKPAALPKPYCPECCQRAYVILRPR